MIKAFLIIIFLTCVTACGTAYVVNMYAEEIGNYVWNDR